MRLVFVGLWVQGGVVGLWPKFDIQIRNPELDYLDLERRREILGRVPDKQQEHEDTSRCWNVAATRWGEYLLLFLWGLAIFDFIGHPVPVEEVESVSIGTLRGFCLYTL